MDDKTKIDILEERCNMQERKLLHLYKELAYFESLKQSGDVDYMKHQANHVTKKAKNIRREIRQYLNPEFH